MERIDRTGLRSAKYTRHTNYKPYNSELSERNRIREEQRLQRQRVSIFIKLIIVLYCKNNILLIYSLYIFQYNLTILLIFIIINYRKMMTCSSRPIEMLKQNNILLICWDSSLVKNKLDSFSGRRICWWRRRRIFHQHPLLECLPWNLLQIRWRRWNRSPWNCPQSPRWNGD